MKIMGEEELLGNRRFSQVSVFLVCVLCVSCCRGLNNPVIPCEPWIHEKGLLKCVLQKVCQLEIIQEKDRFCDPPANLPTLLFVASSTLLICTHRCWYQLPIKLLSVFILSLSGSE